MTEKRQGPTPGVRLREVQIHVISQQKINLPVKSLNCLGTAYFNVISILYMSLLLHFNQFFL